MSSTCRLSPTPRLLLCSDGLTDLVPSASIRQIVEQFAGDPQAVARALVAAANDAGGKDNVTVVYVEGERVRAERARPHGSHRSRAETPNRNRRSTRRRGAGWSERGAADRVDSPARRARRSVGDAARVVAARMAAAVHSTGGGSSVRRLLTSEVVLRGESIMAARRARAAGISGHRRTR